MKRTTCVLLSGLIIGIAVIAGVLFYFSVPPHDSQAQKNATNLIGNWMRTDGDYVIRISSINPDGQVQAAYFNPNPINIAQANAFSQDDTIKFFVELRDVGYPGSKYELLYYPDQDILQGTYFQAQIQQLYNVVFQRMK